VDETGLAGVGCVDAGVNTWAGVEQLQVCPAEFVFCRSTPCSKYYKTIKA
jgi:hypothetical protein